MTVHVGPWPGSGTTTQRPAAGSGPGVDLSWLGPGVAQFGDDLMKWAPRAGQTMKNLGGALWNAAPVLGPAAVALGSVPAIMQGADEAGLPGAVTAATGNIGGAAAGGLLGGMIGGPLAPITATIGAVAGGMLGGGAASGINSYIKGAVNDPSNPVGKALDPFVTSDIDRELAKRQQMADFAAADPMKKMLETEARERQEKGVLEYLRNVQLQTLMAG